LLSDVSVSDRERTTTRKIVSLLALASAMLRSSARVRVRASDEMVVSASARTKAIAALVSASDDSEVSARKRLVPGTRVSVSLLLLVSLSGLGCPTTRESASLLALMSLIARSSDMDARTSASDDVEVSPNSRNNAKTRVNVSEELLVSASVRA
jgi:hypothetical protein